MTLTHRQALERIRHGRGFIAAIDQSGGSTPKTLTGYGLAPDSWSDEETMFALVHEMRERIMSSASFSGERLIGAILFERTMDGSVGGTPVPDFLRAKGIVPFVKIDQGLETERDGAQLMKPIAGLDALLAGAKGLGVFGTKARSFIRRASPSGIAAVVRQQFDLAERVAAAGLLPILEPEYDIAAPDRAAGEAILLDEILASLARLPDERLVMLKLSIPVEDDFYRELIGHPRVARVAALSGGYSRREACERLARNPGMIASFSRALLSDLRVTMSDAEFDAALAEAIDEIYRASA
jgi:fructose-bisphosphate aldolase class I